MATIITDLGKGYTPIPTSTAAGDNITQIGRYTFPVAASAADVVELGVLPANHRLTAARVIAEGTAVIGVVSLLAGEVGSTVGRTAGAAIITTGTAATSGMLNDVGVLTPPTTVDRGIGVTVTGAIVANAGTVTAEWSYVQSVP